MYNGVGIVTPRGTGTSGHVQRNAASVRRRVDPRDARRHEDERRHRTLPKDATLVEHERKREIELLVRQWARDNDIKNKYDKEEAAAKISAKRKELSGEKDQDHEEGEIKSDRQQKRRREEK